MKFLAPAGGATLYKNPSDQTVNIDTLENVYRKILNALKKLQLFKEVVFRLVLEKNNYSFTTKLSFV